MEIRIRQGYVIDGYVLEEMVGSGGFSTVYRARSIDPVPRYDTFIAVKVLHPRRLDRTQIKRFIKEMKISISLRHSNIVKVYAVRRQDWNYFGLMEFLDTDLLKAIRNKPELFNHEKVLDIIKQAGSGLDYIHRNGIVHKDMSPSNILVSYSLEKIKITDFGLARKTGFMQKDNGSGGTEGYIAPERMNGRPADVKTDIYSFGKTMEKIYSELRLAIPDGVRYVVETAVKQKPEERFYDMRELLYFLESKKTHAS
ncbi:MAG: serine/threonine protein kinase [Candidatus Omnitrophica bacterium]|nr:serine/threonine protein kinase [Candidatus Omnitrophota bacterium]